MRISFSASAAAATPGISIMIAAVAAKIRVNGPGILAPSCVLKRHFISIS
jgi:hypothetical protein